MCSPAAQLVQGAFLGRIFDAYGPHVILVPGSFLLVFSTMITSICTQFYQFLIVQGLLTGLSYGMLYVNFHIDPSHYADAESARFYPSFASISTHFMRLRATAVGIAIAGSGVGEPRTFDAEKTGRLTRRARRCGLPHHLSATLRSHRLRLDGAGVRIPLARPMRHWKRNDHQSTDASSEIYVTSA